MLPAGVSYHRGIIWLGEVLQYLIGLWFDKQLLLKLLKLIILIRDLPNVRILLDFDLAEHIDHALL
jgi:hypothetical protein